MKRCFKCGETKPLAEFYPHKRMRDGHLNKCKTCTRGDVHRNYEARRPQYSVYERARYQEPERHAQVLAACARHRARNPVKAKARIAVHNAIRDGRLARKPCEVCGTTVRVQAHHHDYTRPLDVRWLCFKCHREFEHGQVVTAA